MAKIGETIIGIRVYENNTEFLGVATATLPSLASVTTEVSGAGVLGSYNSAIMGHMQAMTLSLNFRTLTKESVMLNEPRDHQLELRVPTQERDKTTRQTEVREVKHVLVAAPTNFTGGEAASAASGNVTNEFSVTYWATYIDGKKVQEIDLINYIYFVNGKDWMAPVRKALGI